MGSLKNLLKQRPTADDVTILVAEIKTDGPRGAAVTAGALVDDLLRELLVENMVTLTEGEHNILFTRNGPLANFGSRIDVAYAFGFFKERTRHDLRLLKGIRNAFAHVNLNISFATPEIAKLCGAFHCLEDVIDAKERSPQEQLAIATQCILIHLISKSNVSAGAYAMKSLD